MMARMERIEMAQRIEYKISELQKELAEAKKRETEEVNKELEKQLAKVKAEHKASLESNGKGPILGFGYGSVEADNN